MPATFIEPLAHVGTRVSYTEGNGGSRALASWCDLGDSDLFVAFCERQRELHGRKVEGYGIRVSWDDAELSPDRPEDVLRAVEFGRRLAGDLADGYPCHIVVHGDGAGGGPGESSKLHLHIELANARSITGAALRNNRSVRAVRAASDNLARDFGFSVIGETPKRRAAWEESRGFEPTATIGDGWSAKRLLLDDGCFERVLGDAVYDALESAISLADFKSKLADRGVSIVEIPKREKDAATGKKVDVLDPTTNEPIICCWRYVMKDVGGRSRRRKDANLSTDLRMHDVLSRLADRESAIARERADRLKAERIVAFERAEANEKVKNDRRPIVVMADVSADLEMLSKVRILEAARSDALDSDPVIRIVGSACADDESKRRAAIDLQRELRRTHAARDALQIAAERPEHTLATALKTVAMEARNIVTRMLAALWRMRIAAERALGRKITELVGWSVPFSSILREASLNRPR